MRHQREHAVRRTTVTARTSGEPKDEKRNHFIGIAMNLICRYGVRKTTLEDVAKAAGCAPTSLYYYFRNKEQLVREAVAELFRETLQHVQIAVDAASNPEEQLVAAWRAQTLTAQQSGFAMSLDAATKSELIPIARDILADFEQRYAAIIERILSRGASTKVFRVKDVKSTAKVLSYGVSALLFHMVGEASPDEIAPLLQILGNLMIYGLKAT